MALSKIKPAATSSFSKRDASKQLDAISQEIVSLRFPKGLFNVGNAQVWTVSYSSLGMVPESVRDMGSFWSKGRWFYQPDYRREDGSLAGGCKYCVDWGIDDQTGEFVLTSPVWHFTSLGMPRDVVMRRATEEKARQAAEAAEADKAAKKKAAAEKRAKAAKAASRKPKAVTVVPETPQQAIEQPAAE